MSINSQTTPMLISVPSKAWVKFTGSWWELGSHTSRLSSHAPLAGSHMSGNSSQSYVNIQIMTATLTLMWK